MGEIKVDEFKVHLHKRVGNGVGSGIVFTQENGESVAEEHKNGILLSILFCFSGGLACRVDPQKRCDWT